MQTNIESTVKQDKGNKCTVGKIFGHEKNVGFEPRTSHLLFTIVAERPRVQIPVNATFFFMSENLLIFPTVHMLPLSCLTVDSMFVCILLYDNLPDQRSVLK